MEDTERDRERQKQRGLKVKKITARKRNRETNLLNARKRLFSVGFDSKAMTLIQVIA